MSNRIVEFINTTELESMAIPSHHIDGLAFKWVSIPRRTLNKIDNRSNEHDWNNYVDRSRT